MFTVPCFRRPKTFPAILFVKCGIQVSGGKGGVNKVSAGIRQTRHLLYLQTRVSIARGPTDMQAVKQQIQLVWPVVSGKSPAPTRMQVVRYKMQAVLGPHFSSMRTVRIVAAYPLPHQAPHPT